MCDTCCGCAVLWKLCEWCVCVCGHAVLLFVRVCGVLVLVFVGVVLAFVGVTTAWFHLNQNERACSW